MNQRYALLLYRDNYQNNNCKNCFIKQEIESYSYILHKKDTFPQNPCCREVSALQKGCKAGKCISYL